MAYPTGDLNRDGAAGGPPSAGGRRGRSYHRLRLPRSQPTGPPGPTGLAVVFE